MQPEGSLPQFEMSMFRALIRCIKYIKKTNKYILVLWM